MTDNPPRFKDVTLSIVERVDDLVCRMTLDEKIAQMVFDAPAIERLDVAKHNWWNECLHGVGRAGIAATGKPLSPARENSAAYPSRASNPKRWFRPLSLSRGHLLPS